MAENEGEKTPVKNEGEKTPVKNEGETPVKNEGETPVKNDDENKPSSSASGYAPSKKEYHLTKIEWDASMMLSDTEKQKIDKMNEAQLKDEKAKVLAIVQEGLLKLDYLKEKMTPSKTKVAVDDEGKLKVSITYGDVVKVINIYPHDTFSKFRDEAFRPFPEIKGKSKETMSIYCDDVKIIASGKAKMSGANLKLENGNHLTLKPEMKFEIE